MRGEWSAGRIAAICLPFFLLLLLFWGPGCRNNSSRPGIKVVLLNGTTLELNRHTIDQGVVLTFWNRNSPPSLAMLGELAQQAGEFQDKGIRFLAVATGRQNLSPHLPSDVAGLEPAQDTNYSLARQFGVEVLPTVLILDKNSRVVARFEGYGSPEALKQKIVQLTEVSGR